MFVSKRKIRNRIEDHRTSMLYHEAVVKALEDGYKVLYPRDLHGGDLLRYYQDHAHFYRLITRELKKLL